MITLNKNPTQADLRTFGIGMLIGCGVIGGLFWWAFPSLHAWWTGHAEVLVTGLSKSQKAAILIWSIGAVMSAAGLFAPRPIARACYIIWMGLAHYMGMVTTPIFFTLLFVILLPFFSLIRLADPLRKKLKPGPESYWEPHKHHEPTLERAMRPF